MNSVTRILALCVLPLTAVWAAETVIIDDPLLGATKGEQVGGDLTPGGYRPGAGLNHILYRVPRTIREGYVQFEVKGMDTAAVPVGAEHGFMAMYDGRGVSEPAQYFRDLKSNFYRWNLHWRNGRKIGLKCVIACAAPTPERLGAATAQYEKDKRDWSDEPTGRRVNWDPERWHRIRVEWRGRTFRVTVDGEEYWKVAGPFDYAPADHRLWLGCAPGKEKKYVSQVANIEYRNLLVVATDGETPARAATSELK